MSRIRPLVPAFYLSLAFLMGWGFAPGCAQSPQRAWQEISRRDLFAAAAMSQLPFGDLDPSTLRLYDDQRAKRAWEIADVMLKNEPK
jgi:hypothetical protein